MSTRVYTVRIDLVKDLGDHMHPILGVRKLECDTYRDLTL